MSMRIGRHFNGTIKKILLRQTCPNRTYFFKILDHLSHKNTCTCRLYTSILCVLYVL